MSQTNSYLPWLTPVDDALLEQLFSKDSEQLSFSKLVALSKMDLSDRQCTRFLKYIRNVKPWLVEQTESRCRIAVLSNYTVEIAIESTTVFLLQEKLSSDIFVGQYNQIAQEVLSVDSPLYKFRPDTVLFSLDHRWLIDNFNLSSTGNENLVDNAFQELVGYVETLKKRIDVDVILQTVAVPQATFFGQADSIFPGSLSGLISSFNEKITVYCRNTNTRLMDVHCLSNTVGTRNWFNPIQWNSFKFSFDERFNRLFSYHFARILLDAKGKSKKCLVLDLDNTLWGGVVGDDGYENLLLGSGSSVGEAHASLQKYVKNLSSRGIVLAVCSKNNYEVATTCFKLHQDMSLNLDDIAVFMANWDPKPDNIVEIANTLNIGLDAIVFLDDNPAERAHVRASLPEVCVPELPSDPAKYEDILASACYFETQIYNKDDLLRSESYKANTRRNQDKALFLDINEYLTNLEMTLDVTRFRNDELTRITQLTNKTNQFNLTTLRLNNSQVQDYISCSKKLGIQARLTDKFGEMGMISLVYCSIDNNLSVLHIDNWLMSCRVLGRDVEWGLCIAVMDAAVSSGCDEISAKYVPTKKNNMVSEFFETFGFELVNENSSGEKTYRLSVLAFQSKTLPFKLYLGSRHIPNTSNVAA